MHATILNAADLPELDRKTIVLTRPADRWTGELLIIGSERGSFFLVFDDNPDDGASWTIQARFGCHPDRRVQEHFPETCSLAPLLIAYWNVPIPDANGCIVGAVNIFVEA